MKILVTGGAGFIGSHLAEKLASNGHQVKVIDSLSNVLYSSELKVKNLEMFDKFGIEFIQMDLNDPKLEKYATDLDVVINQAAIPGLVKSWTHLDEYMNSNVVGLGNLLKVCSENQVGRFIQISTSSVYGQEAVGDEHSELKPFSPYGVSKLAAENLVRAYSLNFGLSFTILRYFSVYGPRQRPDMAYQKFITSIIDNKPIVVYGDGKQTRTNTFVGDIVNGTISAFEVGEISNGKTYNLCGSTSVTLLEAIELIESMLGKKAKVVFEQATRGDQKNTAGDTTLAQEHLNFWPEVDLKSGIEEQIAWNTKALKI